MSKDKNLPTELGESLEEVGEKISDIMFAPVDGKKVSKKIARGINKSKEFIEDSLDGE